MIETRGAADQLLASAWMELEGRMPCRCPTSLSPVTLHHYWSDTNLIHCPISSQQISHRHDCNQLGGYPERGLGDSLSP